MNTSATTYEDSPDGLCNGCDLADRGDPCVCMPTDATMTDAQLWERWVGRQSPEQFAELCDEDHASEIRRYVDRMAPGFGAEDEDLDPVKAGLLRHLAEGTS